MDSKIKEIFSRAQNGDQEAFRLIYDKYLTPIYRYIYFRVKDKNTADDLTQEVFVKAFDRINRIEAENNNPLTYFYTIARNLLIDNYRHKHIETIANEEAEIYLIHNDNPEKIYTENEDARQLMKALNKISDLEAEVIILKFLKNFDNSEIAKVLDKSEMAVRQLQSRGLKSLKKIYENI
jgi:RNA polymerase sigma-70 factor (ECF subfamily)